MGEGRATNDKVSWQQNNDRTLHCGGQRQRQNSFAKVNQLFLTQKFYTNSAQK